MTPRCYNRAPYQGAWQATGRYVGWKPVYRQQPLWFVDRCATHDGVSIGPNGENYPQAHGWDCTGCRWNPETKQ